MPRFRLAEESDAKALVELHNAVADDLTRKLGKGYWGGHRSLRAQRDRIRKSNETPQHHIFVLPGNEGIIATVVLTTRRAPFWRKALWREPNAEAICVYDLAVLPAREGTGLGRMAMRLAEEMARSMGLDYVRLDAFAQNPHSNGFYSHLGYEMRGELVVGGVPLNLFEKSV